jgi:hypothetical protein
LEEFQYPIGRFDWQGPMTAATRAAAIEAIGALPAQMRAAVAGLDASQMATPYRPGGWTLTQVVHHVGDSHVNGFTRIKLGLTEDTPTIKPYDEAAFARLADVSLAPETSLQLLDALHARWSAVLAAMTEADFQRSIVHPENGRATLDRFVHQYGWHSRHHVAHITRLRQRQGW